jgi:hypothetical protein
MDTVTYFDSDARQNAIAIINNWCKDYLKRDSVGFILSFGIV